MDLGEQVGRVVRDAELKADKERLEKIGVELRSAALDGDAVVVHDVWDDVNTDVLD